MPGLVAGCRLGVSLVPRSPDFPSLGTKSGCPNPAGPSRSTSTWGLRGPAGRSGWQFMVCGTSSLPTHDLSRRCFPWKAAPTWNPLPGRQAAFPQVLAEFTGRRGGAERGVETSWEGALSIRNDKWISSAPGLSPSTFRCAEALQFHGALKFLCAEGKGPAWLSSDPIQTRSVSEAAEGLRETQRQGDAEMGGERQGVATEAETD